MILATMLKHLIRRGSLRVTFSNNIIKSYGDGTGPLVHIELTDSAAERRIALDPDLGLGECYMDGTLQLRHGAIFDLLTLAMTNTTGHLQGNALHKAVYSARVAMRRINQQNPVSKAKENVAHHYDLSGKLYDLFLDTDRQYSCAYFETPNATLEQAQLAKKRHIAAKLDIKPGMKVLDIGSGWGGLGIYLAEICGAEVTGVTLSEEQHKLSNARAHQRGVSDRTKFLLKDYRHLETAFDRIVSVGMFEHVGIGHFPEFFGKVKSLLKADGCAILHSINRSDGPGVTSAWISKYMFPGGYVPALSEVVPHLENNGLFIADIEILRLHYAETIRHWRTRFNINREQSRALYDERFCRMWEFYLAASECTFRFGGMNNFQIQFTKNQHALPMTRDYIAAAEATLKIAEAELPQLRIVASQ
jgi:cyclopropane-fatty-acyl-phospholipid synthase